MNKNIKICLPAALIPIAAVGVLYGFSSSASATAPNTTTTGMTVASTSCSYALTVPASVTLTGANYTGASDTFSVVDTTMTLLSGGGGVPATPCSWTSGTGASLGMSLTGTGFAGSPTNYDTLLSTAPLIVSPVATNCTANLGTSLSWASTTVPTHGGAFATLLHDASAQTCTFSTTYSFTIPAAKTVYGSSITLTGPVLTTTNTVT
jgi:hypothetical protein